MAIYDTAIEFTLKDPMTAGILILAGFLIGHTISAFIFGFSKGFKTFDKIKGFIKGFFFIYK